MGKVQFILAACLVAAAFAAPIDNFVDDIVPTEPQAATEECEDPIETTEPAPAPTEAECVDEPIETTKEPELTTAEECVEEETEAPAADECEEEGNEVAPELNMRIEPAAVLEDVKIIKDENLFPAIEECEE